MLAQFDASEIPKIDAYIIIYAKKYGRLYIYTALFISQVSCIVPQG